MNTLFPMFSVLFGLCCAVGCGPMDVSGYDGDGTISPTIVPKVSVLVDAGYFIDFDTFSLAEPFEATYKLASLPDHKSSCTFGLMIEQAEDEIFSATHYIAEVQDARISMRIESNGKVHFECSKRIENCVQSIGGGRFFIYCQSNLVYGVEADTLNSGEGFVVTLGYTPGEKLFEHEAFFRMKRGGGH